MTLTLGRTLGNDILAEWTSIDPQKINFLKHLRQSLNLFTLACQLNGCPIFIKLRYLH